MAPLLAQWQSTARPTAGERRADPFSGIGQPTRMSKATETLARSCVRFHIDSGSYGRRPLRPKRGAAVLLVTSTWSESHLQLCLQSVVPRLAAELTRIGQSDGHVRR